MIKIVVIIAVSLSIINAETSDVHLAGRCARAAKSCILAPEATQGPYYWNTTVRKDITEGKNGIRFRLTVNVLDTTACSPLENAVVDLWHCDAEGIYSHYIASSLGQFNAPTDNSTFFRGQQVTNAQGVAVFDTVYPGWYRGRATHMHVKVHVGATLTNLGGALFTKGGHTSYTGQIFFNDTITDEVAKLTPYTSQTVRRTRNDEDGIYRQAQGSTTIVPVRFLTSAGVRGAMSGETTLGINPNAVSKETGGPMGPPPGSRPSPPPPGSTGGR